MVKYARLVFEVEIPDGASNPEITDGLLNTIGDYIAGDIGINDVEISTNPYEGKKVEGPEYLF